MRQVSHRRRPSAAKPPQREHPNRPARQSCQKVQPPGPPLTEAWREHELGPARTRLGVARAEGVFAEGQALTWEQAIELALGSALLDVPVSAGRKGSEQRLEGKV